MVTDNTSSATAGRPRCRSAVAVPELVEKARAGDARSVGRLISLVEDASPLLREVMAEICRHDDSSADRAITIGITGAPGVGKSTSPNALVPELRKAGQRGGGIGRAECRERG